MAVNRSEVYSTLGIKGAIPLNRHGSPQLSVSVQLADTATYTIQGTISQINRDGNAAIWNDLPTMTGLNANAFHKVENSPIEAIRINITAMNDNVVFQVAQNT